MSEATQAAADEERLATVAAQAAVPDEEAYEPPFPGRLDLFSPPKQGVRVAKQTTGDSSESVILLGFAKLDAPRAVLSVDRIIRPIAEGEEIGGVKVISISPPQAVLQRGRSRWTASLQ